jgi:hypothetical protein
VALDGAGVFFSPSRQEIHAFDPSAAFVWRALAHGLAPDAIACALAESSGVRASAARRKVAALVRLFRERGWLVARGVRRPPAPLFAAVRRYALLGTCFRVRYATREQLALVHPALAHLAAARGAPHDVTLDLRDEGGAQQIAEDGRVAERTDSLTGLAPIAKAAVWRIAVNRRRYFMQIHGAVLLREGRCVLLPGAPGSGKSTLAAALVAAGFRYLSDEAALLEGPRLEVRPVPLALTVKPGAVPLLEPLYPGVAELPAHERDDGKIVRYLAPPRRALPSDADRTFPITTLVFPRVAPRHDLRPLERPEALRRLLAQCLVLPRALETRDVRRLVGWLRGLRCFELDSGPLPSAVAAIRRAHRW